MHMSVDDVSRKILSKEVDKQEAMRLFQSLDKAAQSQVLTMIRPFAAVSADLRPRTTVDQRDLTDDHRAYIAEVVKRYDAFVPKSKANVLANQVHFVDQRRAFHLIKDLKKLHFQITYTKAEGAYVHDADGNRYIDISGDMGVNLFGHRAPFLIDAIKHSLDQGIPLVGYSDMIFQACKLFCEITGHERTLFTQSGTEAVMFAVRIARASTGRKKIVLFDGSYHGLSDAVAVTKDLLGNSFPMAPGILQEFADQVIVLDYGEMTSLDAIEARAGEIAAVLVEPVQSRHPYRKPVEFLKALRQLTIEKDIPLIFDEMITGFRVCHRGAQGLFGIQADMATYGKIPGGGLPTGVIAGAAKYMDLVDGGTWQFDDESMPGSKRTGMAGTHSQNPLKIAAALAVLSEIKKRSSEMGPDGECACFQQRLNQKTSSLAETLNAFFREESLPVVIESFGSLFRFRFVDSFWGVTEALFFILLRMQGVETNIQGNCFLTTAHTDEDIDAVIAAVRTCMSNLKRNDFFPEAEEPSPEQAAQVFEQIPLARNGDQKTASRRNDRERLKALLSADLALAEKLGGVG